MARHKLYTPIIVDEGEVKPDHHLIPRKLILRGMNLVYSELSSDLRFRSTRKLRREYREAFQKKFKTKIPDNWESISEIHLEFESRGAYLMFIMLVGFQ